MGFIDKIAKRTGEAIGEMVVSPFTVFAHAWKGADKAVDAAIEDEPKKERRKEHPDD